MLISLKHFDEVMLLIRWQKFPAKAVLPASATDFSKDDVSEVVFSNNKNGKIIGFVVTVIAHDGATAEILSSLLDFQQMEHILEHLFLQ